ncbi:hypothetical protein L1887_03232 [Cichorium endivia]|nr:hypothetical protein L1887_03232 [Cichorium endivia]
MKNPKQLIPNWAYLLQKLGYGSELTDFISNGSVGAGEESSPAKNSKPNSTQLQETTPQPPYPDWSQIPTESES